MSCIIPNTTSNLMCCFNHAGLHIITLTENQCFNVGTMATSFSIVGASGVVSTTSVLDYEVGPKSYGDGTVSTLGIQVVDGNGGTSQVPLIVTVADINDGPVFTATIYTGSVNEEETIGFTVTFAAAVAATDEDADSLVYSLVGKVLEMCILCIFKGGNIAKISVDCFFKYSHLHEYL